MDITKFLRNKGYDTVDRAFYAQISVWYSWYVSNVRRFHRYRVYRGAGCYVNCRRQGLGMAKKVCEDIADLLLNERVTITLDDEATHNFVHQILDDNRFLVMGNDYQERKAFTGTVAYIPYLDNAEIAEDGTVIFWKNQHQLCGRTKHFPGQLEQRQGNGVHFRFSTHNSEKEICPVAVASLRER